MVEVGLRTSDRAGELLRSEPALSRVVSLARERVGAVEVWIFGSRARADARPGSDWDFFLVLPDAAPDRDLDPRTAWSIGRDAGLTADVVSERETNVRSAADVPNTLAFVLAREGIRLG